MREPLFKDSETFSAISPQQLQRKKPSRRSSHWPSLFLKRLLTATVKFATWRPEGVNRSSGSSVRLPTRVTLLSAITTYLPGLLRPNDLAADELVGDAQGALQLRDRVLRSFERGHEVVALVLVADLVGEPAIPPPIDVRHLASVVPDEGAEPVHGFLDVALVEARVHDDHGLVISHASSSGLEPHRGAEALPRRCRLGRAGDVAASCCLAA